MREGVEENAITCDVYFKPQFVWEIKAADLSLSPMHTAGLNVVESDRGIALRFNRHIRDRPDKAPHQATTTAQCVEMYKAQVTVTTERNKNLPTLEEDDANDDDFDL